MIEAFVQNGGKEVQGVCTTKGAETGPPKNIVLMWLGYGDILCISREIF